MNGRSALTRDDLAKVHSYDPETGLFDYRRPPHRGGPRRMPGTITFNGYVCISIANKKHYAHRLAWLYMTGAWPLGQIDHIDGNRTNNRFANLRDVSPTVNGQNRKTAQKGTRSGVLGVVAPAHKQPSYRAQIKVYGRGIHLGSFATVEEASAAYVAAKRRLHEGNTL